MSVPIKMYWMGQDVDELPREKLIEIIGVLNRQLETTRAAAISSAHMLASVAKVAARRA